MKNSDAKKQCAATGLLLILPALGLSAAQYGIVAGNFDGGGGNAAGGTFTVTCAIGQPEAGTATINPYTAQGGFVPAFTLPLTPKLNMTRSGGMFTFTWPNIGTGFVLEQGPTSGGPWQPQGIPMLSGQIWTVTIPVSASSAFFRLRKSCPK